MSTKPHLSPLTKQYSPPGSPPYFDLRNKLTKRRTLSRSRSRSPGSRSTKSSSVRTHHSVTKLRRSRSPTRSYSRQASKSSRRRTPSPRARTRSPQFRTPYHPHRRSGDHEYRGGSSSGEKSFSQARNGKSSSRLPRENSSRLPEERSSNSKDRRSSSHRLKSPSHSTLPPRRVVESTLEPQTTKRGDKEPSVRKILQKIVAKTEKKKKGKKEKMELVLRKAKKKKSKKSKPDDPSSKLIKAEPLTDHQSPPQPTAVNIKTEPGAASLPSPATATPSHLYYKPVQEIELQPILGHSKCRICKSYFPDADDRRSQHLAQHPDRVFFVNLPVDTFYYDMEEAISHLAKFGINRMELQQKVKDCNLIKLPTNLKGFSCDICKMLDTNNEKDFMIHVKEECKVMAKEERAQHLVCFCRGCHARFSNKSELEQHVGQGGCWPSMMVVNRLYDMSGGEVAAKDKVVMDRERMVRVKQEKVERAQQIQIKREMFEKERDPVMPQLAPLPSPSEVFPKFNAYSLPSSQEALQPAPSAGHTTSDMQKILQSLQNNQVMQSMQPNSHLQQMDMMSMQGIQQIQQMHFPSPSFLPQQLHFTVPPHNPLTVTSHPPVYSQSTHSHHSFSPPNTNRETVKTERGAMSPRLSDFLQQSRAEPSPPFSPLKDSHRSRSRRPSPVVLPPAPSTPLPPLDDLFTAGGSSGSRQRYPSGDSSIVSCDSLPQQQKPQSAKIVSTHNCQRSACLWTDPHISSCSKLPIMAKCSTDKCNWYDLHRDNPLCDKLSFYCNCKKEREGVYKYYDDLPQVRKIPTHMEGTRDFSVKEPKHMVMRLLYRTVSKVVGDPRLSKNTYPIPHKIPARSFRGKRGRRRGWGEGNVICTWSGVSMVTVRNGNNPHIVSDHDSDVEVCVEEEEVVRAKKFTKKRKEKGSSEEREIW